MEAQTENHVLEINLISAQGLKEPSANLRRLQTYAVAWIDPNMKLRTRIDRVGAGNPTWNDKFFFRVSPDFLSAETAGVSIEIYAVGLLRDQLVGTVRLLNSNFIPPVDGGVSNSTPKAFETPSFLALQIRRPSGRFQGVLNIAAMVADGSDFAANMSKVSAFGYREIVEDSLLRRRITQRQQRIGKSQSMATIHCDGAVTGSDGSSENSLTGSSAECSDGSEYAISSPTLVDSPLKELNVIKQLAGKSHLRSASDGGGMLRCFLMQRRMELNGP